MSGLIGSCIGSFVGACGCKALSCCMQGMSSKDSRLPYLMMTFGFLLLAGVLRYYGGPVLVHLRHEDFPLCTDPDKCYGIAAVYRICFALCTFFTTLALALQSRSLTRMGLDTGYWVIKLVALVGLLVVAYLLPNQVFDAFRHVSQGIGGIFLVLQIVLLIDFAYSWNESWLREDRDWKSAILAASGAGYVFSIAAAVLLAKFYASGEGCSLEQGLITTTIIGTIVFSVISASERCEHGAILPSAVCSVYCYWILYGALSDSPHQQCKKWQGGDSSFEIAGGFVMAAFSVCYAAFNLATNSGKFAVDGGSTQLLDNFSSEEGDSWREETTATDPAELDAGALNAQDSDSYGTYDRAVPINQANEAGMHSSDTSGEELEASADPTKFHFVMASSACYACMLLTDWGSSTNGQEPNGLTTLWIQTISQWLCALLYTWSLIAPSVLTNRSFD